MSKLIVADAGPLIAFARIDHLTLLYNLWDSVLVPEAVVAECVSAKERPGAKTIQHAIEKEILKVSVNPNVTTSTELFESLGAGESAAIQLALQQKIPLLIDERAGRRIAQKLKISIIGTAGIILLAKKRKLIKDVKSLIIEFKQVGYYLSDDLIAAVLKQAKEI